jgi:DNA-binding NtrC family response regulator
VTPPKLRVLIVDDELRHAELLARELRDRGMDAEPVRGGEEALRRVADDPPQVVITDLRMPPPDGLELLRRLRASHPQIAVLLVTAYADTRVAVQAMRDGAYDFLLKDPAVDVEQVALRLARLGEERAARVERDQLRAALSSVQERALPIVGDSPPVRAALDLLRKVAPTPSTVLLLGETGSGKDLFARALHLLSPRAAGPWVKVNCGALPEALLESELFGHERGAFTGAVARKLGRFEQAHRGTIFLDEIGELTPPLQVKLLQAIEEKAFVRLGGRETIHVDARVVAATNRDLEADTRAGRFREDLLFRLSVFPIRLPPLRERAEDIARLTEFFLAQAGHSPEKLSPLARAALERYPFPGNVRELQHVLERALILAGPDPIEVGHLDLRRAPGGEASAGAATSPAPLPVPESPPEGLSLEALEQALLVQALEKSRGNKSQAARLLGLTRRTLYSRLEKHGLRAPSGAEEEGDGTGGSLGDAGTEEEERE